MIKLSNLTNRIIKGCCEVAPLILPLGSKKLLIYISVDLPQLFREEKKYFWSRPTHCPSCGGVRLWSHGYVRRNFDGFDSSLWIKRFRCPDCQAVHTMRPIGYSSRVQAPKIVVFLSLFVKILFEQWLSEICSRRQRYWLSTFKHQICRNHNVDYTDTNSMLKALNSRFSDIGSVLHICLLYFAINYYLQPLHLPFLVTKGGPSP